MEITESKIQQYSEMHTSPETELLARLNRETYARILFPRMLSGHHMGRMLSMISKMIHPEKILEIGTYTGYSAICLSEGLKEGGEIYTIEINSELEDMVIKYFREAGLDKTIKVYFGNAGEIIPELTDGFDLIFIDADKGNYSCYYDLVIDKLKPGGIILADNVLWSGKVIDTSQQDKDTRALRKFNDKVAEDSRVENVLIPVRDGLMMIRKI